jgi:glycerophosphoryl diester phosphodiesterase
VPGVSALTSDFGRVKRVGHKGADLLVAGNTRASFDAALAAGVDMIEFDVLKARGDGRLLLSHDHSHAAGAETFEQGLKHLATPAFAGIDFDVDLKLPGYEREVVDVLSEHGLLERSLISTGYPPSHAILREIDPSIRIGWSVPRVKRDYTRSWWAAPTALGVLAVGRRVFPRIAAEALREGRCDAIMAQWRLVTPALARAVEHAGGQLYVWTVDDARMIRRLVDLGVTGVITNDPTLFDR